MSREEQIASIRSHQQYKRDQYLNEMAKASRFDHKSSTIRAQLLVMEAKRLEKQHLQHQIEHCNTLLSKSHSVFKQQTLSAVNASPIRSGPSSPKAAAGLKRDAACIASEAGSSTHSSSKHCKTAAASAPSACAKPKCACLSLHPSRLLTAMWRARNILSRYHCPELVEQSVHNLFAHSNSAATDAQIADDLLIRYNIDEPQPTPELWLACAKERLANLDSKWKSISWNVTQDMKERDMFPHVIRNLSVMRVFLEGSQSAEYTSDNFERMRRESTSMQLLNSLRHQGKLFVE